MLLALLSSVLCVSAAVHRARRNTDADPPVAEQAAAVDSGSPPYLLPSGSAPPSPSAPVIPPPSEPEAPSNVETSNFSIGSVIYSVVGALLAGCLMFLILYDPIRKAFINLIDKAFGTETGNRKRRDALDAGLAQTVAEAFDTFTSMQDKIEAIQGLVRE